MTTLISLILIAFFFKVVAIACYFAIEMIDEYDTRFHAAFYVANGINFILWLVVSVWCAGATWGGWKVW